MTEAPPSLVRGSAIMLLSMIVGGALAVLISIVAARQLSVANFGVYSLIISIQGVVGIFASFSINSALAKYVSEYRARNSTDALAFARVGMLLVLLFSAVSCAIYVALAGIIGEGLYENAEIASLIPLSALVVFSVVFNSTAFGIVQGCQQIKWLAFIRMGSPLLSLAAIMALVGTLEIKGVLLGLFIGQIAIASVALVALNASGFPLLSRSEGPKNSTIARKLFAYAFPATLMGLVIAPVQWLGNTELTIVSGIDAMGLFAVAFLFYQVFITIPNSVVIPLLPRVSQLSVASIEEVRRIVVDATKTMSVLLFPLVFGVALFARPVVEILYGSSYRDAGALVYLMCAASYFVAQGAMTGATIAGLGRMWMGLALNLVWAVAFLAITFTTIPMWDATGLALAYASSFLLYLVVAFAVSRHYLKVDMKGSYLTAGLATLLFLAGYVLFEAPMDLGWIERVLVLVAGSALLAWADKSVVKTLLERFHPRAS